MAETVDPTTGEVLTAPRPKMPPEVAQAIVAVMKQVRQLGKDDKNQHGGYKYVSVDKFYDLVGHKMAEAGLFVLMDEVSTKIEQVAGKDSKWLWATYAITLFHESGAEYGPLTRDIALPASGPQAFGSGQSYVEKQFLRALFKIPTGDKDADDVAQDESGASTPAGTARKAAPKQEGGGQQQKPADNGGGDAAPDPDKERCSKAFNTMRRRAGEAITQGELKEIWEEFAEERALIQNKWPARYGQLVDAFAAREKQIEAGASDPAP